MKTLVANSTDACKPALGSRILILDIRMGFDAIVLLNEAPMGVLNDGPQTWVEKKRNSATVLSTVIIVGGSNDDEGVQWSD